MYNYTVYYFSEAFFKDFSVSLCVLNQPPTSPSLEDSSAVVGVLFPGVVVQAAGDAVGAVSGKGLVSSDSVSFSVSPSWANKTQSAARFVKFVFVVISIDVIPL